MVGAYLLAIQTMPGWPIDDETRNASVRLTVVAIRRCTLNGISIRLCLLDRSYYRVNNIELVLCWLRKCCYFRER